jgi:hypothetical protein
VRERRGKKALSPAENVVRIRRFRRKVRGVDAARAQAEQLGRPRVHSAGTVESLMARGPSRARPSTQLRKDFGIFFEGGFLAAVGLILLLSAIEAGLLVGASYKYGIPPIIPW